MKTRDQERAFRAYECADQVRPALRREYKTLVNSFGATVMQCGLIAALAFVKRYQNEAVAVQFLDHLARSSLPGLPDGKTLIDRLCNASMADYMLATRECLHVAVWFRRAVQLWPDAEHAGQGDQS